MVFKNDRKNQPSLALFVKTYDLQQTRALLSPFFCRFEELVVPKFHIEKSIEINAPAERVRQSILDYHQWEIWSPWLCMEPSAKIDFEATAATPGHAYSWEGDMVGAGRMELAGSDGNTDHMDLTFLKPFKSTAKVKFETTAIDTDNTRVTWHMDSGLPFFMFFMVGTMKAMIGMDYDRGLKMLKQYIETGTVSSNIEIIGVVDMPALHYAGVSSESQLSKISDSMTASFTQLIKSSKDKITDEFCGAIYTDMNIKTQHCHYTAIAPVAESDATGSIPDCRALKVVHTGDYQHLGNAWATANTYQRHNKFKKNKQLPPFELYLNDPQKTPAKDLITEVFIPVNA